jgi:hypothetical protein
MAPVNARFSFNALTCDDSDPFSFCRNRKKVKARLGKPQTGLYEIGQKSVVIV